MPRNMGVAVSQSKQKNRRWLLSEQQLFEDRRLTGAYLEMCSALPSRPEPRHLFDNVASPGRAAYKGRDAVAAAKIAMRAGITTGDRATIEATAQNIDRFFNALRDAALADYYAIVTGQITLDEARVRASKEGGEALHSILASTIAHDDASELTLKEVNEAITAFIDLRERMVVARDAQALNRRPALALS